MDVQHAKNLLNGGTNTSHEREREEKGGRRKKRDEHRPKPLLPKLKKEWAVAKIFTVL